MIESYASVLHHGWLSQEGQSEAYNESHRSSVKVKLFKDFLSQNPNVGKQFAQKQASQQEADDELPIPANDEFNDGQFSNSMYEMHRKNISQALYSQWIWEELRDRQQIGKVLFGPRYNKTGELITYRDSVEEFLMKVDELRTHEIYPHRDCTGIEKDIYLIIRELFYFLDTPYKVRLLFLLGGS